MRLFEIRMNDFTDSAYKSSFPGSFEEFTGRFLFGIQYFVRVENHEYGFV